MLLKKRHLFRVSVVIRNDSFGSKDKAANTTVDIAIENLDPVSVSDALRAYVDQWWSDKPHTITKITKLQYIGELFAEMDYDESVERR